MSKSTNDIAFAIVSETAQAFHIAQNIIADAETASRAKMTAAKHTECRHCQAGLENYLIDNPEATHEETQFETEKLWESCGICSQEYHAHLDRQAAEWQERENGLDNPSDWEVQHGLS